MGLTFRTKIKDSVLKKIDTLVIDAQKALDASLETYYKDIKTDVDSGSSNPTEKRQKEEARRNSLIKNYLKAELQKIIKEI